MSLIATVYANSIENPLPTLKEEDETIYEILFEERKFGGWEIHRDSSVTTKKIITFLGNDDNSKDLTVFLFSGHASEHSLLLEDEEVGVEGIAALFRKGKCPNLKLVILNGCSTAGQVNKLLRVGVPVVIATAAPINDYRAMRFSTSFFRYFCKKYESIEKAYERALDDANITINSITDQRGTVVRADKQKDNELWGLFYSEENNIKQNVIVRKEKTEFIPNELLIKKIWKGLKDYKLPLSRKEKTQTKDQAFKQYKILNSLPHPILGLIQKLISKPLPNESRTFYLEPSADRLKILISTYTACLEVLTFSLIAQLWDKKIDNSLVFPEEFSNSLKKMFSSTKKERKLYNLIPLIRIMKKIFQDNKITPFIEECLILSGEFNQDKEFYKACQGLEEIKNEIINIEKMDKFLIHKFCEKAEQHLSNLMSKLGFLYKYKLMSVKNVGFIKYRHQRIPKYQPNYIDLSPGYDTAGIRSGIENTSMSPSSVLITKTSEEDGKIIDFINLSPFIIDYNTFDNKSNVANLMTLHTITINSNSEYNSQNKLSFRIINYQKNSHKSILIPSEINDSDEDEAGFKFEIIVEQLNYFYELVFGSKVINYEKINE